MVVVVLVVLVEMVMYSDGVGDGGNNGISGDSGLGVGIYGVAHVEVIGVDVVYGVAHVGDVGGYWWCRWY